MTGGGGRRKSGQGSVTRGISLELGTIYAARSVIITGHCYAAASITAVPCEFLCLGLCSGTGNLTAAETWRRLAL